MSEDDSEWVAKVHPLERNAEVEDPLELMAQHIPGDPDWMLQCMLEEFAWLGYDQPQLLALFHDPGYPVLCALREHFGDEVIQTKVASLMSRWGVLQFRETITEDPAEAAEEELQLVHIQLPISPCSGGIGSSASNRGTNCSSSADIVGRKE